MFEMLFDFKSKRDPKGALIFYFGHLVMGALIFYALLFILKLLFGPLSAVGALFLSSLFGGIYSAFLAYSIAKERGWRRRGTFYTLLAFIVGVALGLLIGLVVPTYLTMREEG